MSSVLPLTVIEELMFHQDCAAYPYTCFIRLRFAGCLRRDEFEDAAAQAAERHPMLLASIEPKSRRPRWRMHSRRSPSIEWRTEPVTEAFPAATYLELEQGGLRLIVVVGKATSELIVQFHHACCDGLGIFQFIHDLLVLYALAQDVAVRRAFPSYEPDRLPQRGTFGLTWRKFFAMAGKQSVGLRGVRQFLARSPAPLIPHEREASKAPTPDVYPAACAEHFVADVSAGLREQAASLGVTTNDLLARDLFVAMTKFRRRRNLSEDAWLRLMVPMNLRNTADRRLPAANVVSSVFLDRRGTDVDDRAQLLASIHDEMQLIKDNELGFTFVFSLHFNRLVPGGLRRAAVGNRCNASAIFTNLGKLLSRTGLPKDGESLVCGNVRLDGIEILAPLTPYTCAAFAAGWLGNRLSLTLHHDPRVLSAEHARELLDLFAAQVHSTAGVSLSPSCGHSG
ncbi:MAG: chromosome condensation protein [Planctomycetaceae bacterium]|nr:chromosome condensation protein [Planctomycetaceae bacterium]